MPIFDNSNPKPSKLREASEIPGFNDAPRDEDGNVMLSSIFAGFNEPMEKTVTDIDDPNYRQYVPYPELKKTFAEFFDLTDNTTRTHLRAMNEAEHNGTLTSLTNKLYDQIVSKAHNIDFGEIPKTKGDITKVSNFNDMKDTIAILKGIIKEYKDDPKPVDDLAVCITNIQGRKDMFERAFRANCELPMLMYNNMVMAVEVGISHLITACIEFIKAPKDESYSIQLDKLAYTKSRDNLVYNSIAKFNRLCESGDFDTAMNSIVDRKVRKFTGVSAVAGITVGIIIITNIIPILRELVYLFYHLRVSLSDYFDTQADLLTMNAYTLKSNETIPEDERDEIIEKQNSIAAKFKDVANFFSIKDKKAEVKATKEIENSAKTYKLDDDNNITSEEPDDEDNGSVLF